MQLHRTQPDGRKPRNVRKKKIALSFVEVQYVQDASGRAQHARETTHTPGVYASLVDQRLVSGGSTTV